MSRNLNPIFLLILLCGCSGLEESEKQKLRNMNAATERIYRNHDEIYYAVTAPIKREREPYSWEEALIGEHARITKEFFRCKGNTQNQPILRHLHGQPQYTFDCGGSSLHSLPLRNSKESIYPSLMDLLNYVQKKTEKKVIITCGHRCPTHNTYSDHTSENRSSKHMIGAEVDFYVQGLEWQPEEVVQLLMDYYKKKYADDSELTEFKRYERMTNVTTLPWYNKEIFIKLFKKDEGRDLDNDHRYPYISIQVKWDKDAKEHVTYTWAKAFNGYLRY